MFITILCNVVNTWLTVNDTTRIKPYFTHNTHTHHHTLVVVIKMSLQKKSIWDDLCQDNYRIM